MAVLIVVLVSFLGGASWLIYQYVSSRPDFSHKGVSVYFDGGRDTPSVRIAIVYGINASERRFGDVAPGVKLYMMPRRFEQYLRYMGKRKELQAISYVDKKKAYVGVQHEDKVTASLVCHEMGHHHMWYHGRYDKNHADVMFWAVADHPIEEYEDDV